MDTYVTVSPVGDGPCRIVASGGDLQQSESTRHCIGSTDGLPRPVQRFLLASGASTNRQPICAATVVQLHEDALHHSCGHEQESFKFCRLQALTLQFDARVGMLPLHVLRDKLADRSDWASASADATHVDSDSDRDPQADAVPEAVLRYAAEAPWLPTALLPSDNVAWLATCGSNTAILVVSAGAYATRFVCTFDGATGLLVRMETYCRHGDVASIWCAHYNSFENCGPFTVPTRVSLSWRHAEYYTGHILAVEYEASP